MATRTVKVNVNSVVVILPPTHAKALLDYCLHGGGRTKRGEQKNARIIESAIIKLQAAIELYTTGGASYESAG